ncbi:MAG: cysteine desulfurase family protein [Spirochaetales bacterium]
MIYLDNNGTTFLLDEVKDRMFAALTEPLGNPATKSASGERAAEYLREAREQTARLIGAEPEQIVFTSSGSESNASVVRGTLRDSGRRAFVTSEIEHASIRELCEQLRLERVDVRIAGTRPDGTVDLDHLLELVDCDVALVSLQSINNETGVIQPVVEACETAHSVGALFHTDAAQAVGKSHFSVADASYDYVTFTAHKLHGPAGVGFMYSRAGWEGLPALVTGGSQEFGVRGGTHNLIGIIGAGEAARQRFSRLSESTEHMKRLRDMFEALVLEGLSFCGVNGGRASRVGNTSNLLFDGIDGKALFAQLQGAGIECSQSSACTAQYPEPSRVLRAMGLDYHQAFSSIRFSFGVTNTEAEVLTAAEMVVEKAKQIQAVLGGAW